MNPEPSQRCTTLAFSVACRWQTVSGMEAWNLKETDVDDVYPFAPA